MPSLNRIPLSLFYLAGALSLLACEGLLGPDEDRRTGVIAFFDFPVEIEIPDTVQVGEPFELSVFTYGGGCLREGPTKIKVGGLRVDVTPYDIHSGAEACADVLNTFLHKATLTLTTPGLARFLFHGKQKPDNLPIIVGRDVYVER